MKLSVVLPMLDESDVVEELVRRTHEALAPLGIDYEIVVVDDGSSDGTGDLAAAAGAKVLRNPRPSGQLRATRRGLSEARGEWVAVFDGDLQDPPEVLGQLWPERDGVDVVYAVKHSRGEGRAFTLPRRAYGRLLRWSGANMPPSAGSYLLMEQQVVRRVLEQRAEEGNLAVLVALTGPRFATVSYAKEARRGDDRSRVGPAGLVREGLASLALVWRARLTSRGT